MIGNNGLSKSQTRDGRMNKMAGIDLIAQERQRPDNRVRELTKAGALIAAEIDRLLAIQNEGK